MTSRFQFFSRDDMAGLGLRMQIIKERTKDKRKNDKILNKKLKIHKLRRKKEVER